MSSTGSDATPCLLIVEDDPELRRSLHEHFQLLGYRVVSMNDGAEALRQVLEIDFDAVVCDMVMPRMPGDMFYLAVQRVRPELCRRFVFVTGHGGTPGVKEFLAGLSERVISKPFNLEDLAEAVRRAARVRRLSAGDLEVT